jgi:hypothetical protein
MLFAKSSRSRLSHFTSYEGNSKPTPGPNSLPMLKVDMKIYANRNARLQGRQVVLRKKWELSRCRKLPGSQRGGSRDAELKFEPRFDSFTLGQVE